MYTICDWYPANICLAVIIIIAAMKLGPDLRTSLNEDNDVPICGSSSHLPTFLKSDCQTVIHEKPLLFFYFSIQLHLNIVRI